MLSNRRWEVDISWSPRGAWMRKIALEQAREREKKETTEKKRGNEQTLELLQQRNICRWRSPFQSQHGGMIGASTGSYVYPRICGSFFSCTVLFSLRSIRSPHLGKKVQLRFRRKISNVCLSSSSPVSPFLRSQPGARAERRNAFSSLIPIRDLIPSWS